MKELKLEPLYAISSNGRTKIWEIAVEEISNTEVIIRITHGFEGCKLTESITKITSGKNIGKKNETTALEQAISQAEAKWKVKLNSGYTTNLEEQSKVKLPMLAHDFFGRGKNIIFPAYIQPKLNGVRMLAYKDSTGVLLYSRNGKVFTTLEHLIPELDSILKVGDYLDGEIYNPELNLQEIVSLLKNNSKDNGRELLQYWIYDTINEATYRERFCYLREINMSGYNFLKIVETKLVESREKLPDFHRQYVNQGMEGLMVRNAEGKYKCNFRSTDLQKYKEFQTEEFLIVDVIGGEKGKSEEDCAIFVCQTKSGNNFNVRPKGSRENRKELLLDKEKLINKYLTVKYFEITPGESGVPFHPVGGECIRDYE